MDAVEKVALFSPADVMGYITKLVPQYGHVEEGGVVLEATGDQAESWLIEVEHRLQLAAERLRLARDLAEIDADFGVQGKVKEDVGGFGVAAGLTFSF